jgi:hypothetical protein
MAVTDPCPAFQDFLDRLTPTDQAAMAELLRLRARLAEGAERRVVTLAAAGAIGDWFASPDQPPPAI